MKAEYKTFAHRWFNEVWNKGRAKAIDEMLAPDVVIHGLTDEHGNEIHSAAMFKLFFRSFRGAFPDIHITIEDTLTEGDRIAARCSVRGTHKGEGLGFAPTNQPIYFTGVCITRVVDGKIVESWNHFDFLTMYQQLGVIASLPPNA